MHMSKQAYGVARGGVHHETYRNVGGPSGVAPAVRCKVLHTKRQASLQRVVGETR